MQHTSTKQTGEEDIVGQITLEPGQGKALLLGVYETAIPRPNFEVKLTPDIEDDLKKVLTEVEKEGDRFFSYYFQNFSNKACQVTVIER